MSCAKVEFEPAVLLVDIINVIDDFSSCPIPIGYTCKINLPSEVAPSEKEELFESTFRLIKENIKSIEKYDTPLNISDLSVLKDLISDNSINTKKLFAYLTDKSRIDLILTTENLATLRDLFPTNASLQKQSLPEIKESLLAVQQSYARASVRGLFAHKTELPYELAEKIGSNLGMKTASSVAQVSKNPAKQAKDALEAVDIDNPSLKRFI